MLMLNVNLSMRCEQYYRHSIYKNKYISAKEIFKPNVLHMHAKQ